MNSLQRSLATLVAAGTLGLTTIAPASADGAASTRNIIFGAAAIAGVAVEANVAAKHARAGRVSGYLSDGSAVYADGRIVDRNGDSYYPGHDGRSVSCNDGRCYVANASDPDGYRNANRDRAWNARNRNVDRSRNGDATWSRDRTRSDRADR